MATRLLVMQLLEPTNRFYLLEIFLDYGIEHGAKRQRAELFA